MAMPPGSTMVTDAPALALRASLAMAVLGRTWITANTSVTMATTPGWSRPLLFAVLLNPPSTASAFIDHGAAPDLRGDRGPRRHHAEALKFAGGEPVDAVGRGPERRDQQ